MSGEGPTGRKPDIRLTPPPRIEPVGSKLRSGRGRTDSPSDQTSSPPHRRGRPWWALPTAFGLLLLGSAVAYFVLSAGEDLLRSGNASVERPAAPSDTDLDAALPELSQAEEAVAEAPVAQERADRPAERFRSPVSEPPRATEPNDDGFGRAIADGLAAVEAGEWQLARAAFERAASIRPASPEPAAGLARVEAAESRIRIEDLRVEATTAARAERWHQAATGYRAVLAIDPTLTFARDGLEVAESRAALADRLDFHLGNPERLSAEEVLSEAERLLESARAVKTSGPRLEGQIAELEELVARVQVPVRVALLSDTLTEVTVYRIGRLGTFDRRELELKPGVYTIVGSRAGYRDVRRQLKVEPGTPPEPLEIRCEEKI